MQLEVAIGEIRRHDNAVAVRVHGGWTVVWTSFTDGTSQRGYFYSDGSKTALWAESGEAVSGTDRAGIRTDMSELR